MFHVTVTVQSTVSALDWALLNLPVKLALRRCDVNWLFIPKELTIDSFDDGKSVHSGRRGAQPDAVHRASFATHQMGGFGPPKADFSRLPDLVMLHLWSPDHGAKHAWPANAKIRSNGSIVSSFGIILRIARIND